MSIVLFALIGAAIKASTAYWVCFGIFCAIRTCKAFYAAVKKHDEILADAKDEK